MKVKGTNLSMIRGDSESITISYDARNDTETLFEDGDIVYFTVKYSVNSEKKLLQKIVTEFDNGKAIIEILPEDTKHMPFRTFVYDIQLNKLNGTVTTIVPPSDFTVEGEVTYE
jgi:hypothetical protein